MAAKVAGSLGTIAGLGSPNVAYSVMIDAGSTGSRVSKAFAAAFQCMAE